MKPSAARSTESPPTCFGFGSATNEPPPRNGAEESESVSAAPSMTKAATAADRGTIRLWAVTAGCHCWRSTKRTAGQLITSPKKTSVGKYMNETNDLLLTVIIIFDWPWEFSRIRDWAWWHWHHSSKEMECAGLRFLGVTHSVVLWKTKQP